MEIALWAIVLVLLNAELVGKKSDMQKEMDNLTPPAELAPDSGSFAGRIVWMIFVTGFLIWAFVR